MAHITLLDDKINKIRPTTTKLYKEALETMTMHVQTKFKEYLDGLSTSEFLDMINATIVNGVKTTCLYLDKDVCVDVGIIQHPDVDVKDRLYSNLFLRTLRRKIFNNIGEKLGFDFEEDSVDANESNSKHFYIRIKLKQYNMF